MPMQAGYDACKHAQIIFNICRKLNKHETVFVLKYRDFPNALVVYHRCTVEVAHPSLVKMTFFGQKLWNLTTKHKYIRLNIWKGQAAA